MVKRNVKQKRHTGELKVESPEQNLGRGELWQNTGLSVAVNLKDW